MTKPNKSYIRVSYGEDGNPQIETNCVRLETSKLCVSLRAARAAGSDDPAGYRGAAHRRATEQCHRLTAESASPGFLPGELRPGQWQAVLSAHCVLCPVTCRVRVIGEETE